MAESEEELKSLLMRVKESERAGLKLNIKNKSQKSMLMAAGPITSWQIKGGKVEAVTCFLFLALQSLRLVTAATRSEDNCFLAEKV